MSLELQVWVSIQCTAHGSAPIRGVRSYHHQLCNNATKHNPFTQIWYIIQNIACTKKKFDKKDMHKCEQVLKHQIRKVQYDIEIIDEELKAIKID